MKLRADLLLVKKNLVPSRAKAQALIMAGQVFFTTPLIHQRRRIEKAGDMILEEADIEITEDLKYVSRGGLKLEGALKALHINPQGKVCLDVGASTGGFTDCLLQQGAVRVMAVDVGYGQLHYKLRQDPRVLSFEKVNFKNWDVSQLAEKADLAVADVSFISLTKVLGNIHASLKNEAEALVMVKPQFELSPAEVKKGVVRSTSLREKAVSLVGDFAQKIGFLVLGQSPSLVLGPKGNQEIFLNLKKTMTFKAAMLCVLGIFLNACAHTYKTSPHAQRQVVPSGKNAEYYFIVSEIHYRRNQLREALQNLNNAIKISEEDYSQEDYLRFKRAYLLASLNDLKNAQSDTAKALEQSPNDADYLLLMGKIQHGQQKWDEAVRYYQASIKQNTQQSEAHSLLIEVLLAQKKYPEALKQILFWEKSEPENVAPLFYKASLYQNFFKKPFEALRVYQKILQDDPDNIKALSALADIYVELKNKKKLLETLNEMEVIAPQDPAIKIKLALIYYEDKNYDQAIDEFEDLKSLAPKDDRVIYYLAVMKENTGKSAEAYPLFEQITPKSNFYRDARLHMAFYKKDLGDTEKAIHILEDVQKLKGKNKPDVLLTQSLVEIYRDREDFKKAYEILEQTFKYLDTQIKSLKNSSSSEQADLHENQNSKAELLYVWGITLDKQGRTEEAIAKMQAILEFQPDNASALNYIGYTYAEQNKNLDLAQAMVAKAFTLKNNDPYIMDSLGWVFFKKGDFAKAFLLIEKAHQLLPTEPAILEHLGDIWEKKNNLKKASEFYEKSLEVLEHQKSQSLGHQIMNKPGEDKDRERIRQKIQNLDN